MVKLGIVIFDVKILEPNHVHCSLSMTATIVTSQEALEQKL